MRIREDLQQVWAPDAQRWTMDRIGVSFLDPLDDYELIHRIGSGTYGDVFKVSESPSHLIVNAPPTDSELMSKQTNCHRFSLPVCRGGWWSLAASSLPQPGCHSAASGGPRWNSSSALFCDAFIGVDVVSCRWDLDWLNFERCIRVVLARCSLHALAPPKTVKSGLSRE